jgi:hypothetical protein
MLLAMLVFSISVTASGYRIEQAHTRLVNGVYMLDADIGVEFSPAVREALDNGVPVTITVDMDVVEERPMLWDKHVARLQSSQSLQHHALSGQYVLKNINSGATRPYRTLDAAMEALGTLHDYPMLDEHLVEGGRPHRVRLRARLDIEALPPPLRPLAYLSSLWRQTSEWSTWPLER